MTKSLMALFFIVLAYLYTYPGMNSIFNGNSQLVMSDNTDPAAATFQNVPAVQLWKTNPSRLFYGAVYAEVLDPEKGAAFWMSWSDRWTIILASYFVPIEQAPTVAVVLLLLLDGLCMFLLARYLKWNIWISYGLAISWAFCAFTRARMKVHTTMVGTYHLPLIFLGLFLVVRGKSWKSFVAAAACFLFAVTTIHYFIITTAFLAPLLLLFVALQPEFKSNWKKISLRLVGAAIPAVLFLAWNVLNPIPPDAKMTKENSIPQSGATADGSLHPFLNIYDAHPIDYLAGDISLEPKATDINPLRYLINDYIQHNFGRGNLHERTNGIRWSLILIGLFFVGALLGRKIPRESTTFPTILFFFGIAVFTFWMSLSPDMPMEGLGPSAWLYRLVSQIRVPSRAGIFVHFSLLMIVGYFFASSYKTKFKKVLLMPAVFPLLMVVDYPPLIHQLPMSVVEKPYQHLVATDGSCGTGLYFPFVSAWTDVAFYHFIQKLAGLPCPTVNGSFDPAVIQPMMNRYPPQMEFLLQLPNHPTVADSIERMADCVPLSWIAFHPATPGPWVQALCERLKWKLNDEGVCVTPGPRRPFVKWPQRCVL